MRTAPIRNQIRRFSLCERREFSDLNLFICFTAVIRKQVRSYKRRQIDEMRGCCFFLCEVAVGLSCPGNPWSLFGGRNPLADLSSKACWQRAACHDQKYSYSILCRQLCAAGAKIFEYWSLVLKMTKKGLYCAEGAIFDTNAISTLNSSKCSKLPLRVEKLNLGF